MATSAVLLALASATLVRADASSYQQNAGCNNDQLMRWFDNDKGLWLNNEGSAYWWQSANMLTAFNDLAIQDENVKSNYGWVWDSCYTKAGQNQPFFALRNLPNGTRQKVALQPSAKQVEARKNMRRDEVGFTNRFYDDEGWWAMAWIGALDNTGTKEYRDEAIGIWYDMHDGYNRHHCGGLPWNKDEGQGPVSISNELYIAVGASLANRVGDDQKNIYLDAAKEGWEWFKNSGVINDAGLVQDGLNEDCSVNNPVYSYNQGVIIGGLVEMHTATGDESYLDAAASIADAVTTPGSSMLNDKGILVDGCDINGDCGGDGVQFKGVFSRNLKKLQAVRPSDQWKNFLETNAQSIWNNDLNLDGGGCKNGVYWSGPYTDADASSQSSALDTLNAALAVTS